MPLAPIVRSKRSKKARRSVDAGKDNSEADGNAKGRREERALMVHRLPAGTTVEQLSRVMQKKTRVVAVEVEPIIFSRGTGKTQVICTTR